MSDLQLPLVGLTCFSITPSRSRSRSRLAQNRSYVRALVDAGGAPVLIPHLSNKDLLRRIYESLDGLLLPGGEDVDPAWYGEVAHEKLGKVDREQDETELALARWAMEEGMPLLAICRGIQVLNVALGGSLVQDIPSQVPGAQRHERIPRTRRDHLSHTVSVEAGTRLAQLVAADALGVNSFHHQALKEVAPGLVISGRAPDGVVEAVEGVNHPFALGLQWHPEALVDRDVSARRIFGAFIEASRPR